MTKERRTQTVPGQPREVLASSCIIKGLDASKHFTQLEVCLALRLESTTSIKHVSNEQLTESVYNRVNGYNSGSVLQNGGLFNGRSIDARTPARGLWCRPVGLFRINSVIN